MRIPIRAVLIGKTVPLGKNGVASGTFKRPLHSAIQVTRTGLAGDEQGDRKHHGGPVKAIHHYAFDHYAAWKAERSEEHTSKTTVTNTHLVCRLLIQKKQR